MKASVFLTIAVLFVNLGLAQTSEELRATWDDTTLSDSLRLVAAYDLISDFLAYDSTSFAISEAQRMLAQAQKANLSWAESNAWNAMGQAALLAGNYALCDSAYIQSGIIARELADTSRVIVFLNNYGRVKKQRGEYLPALKMFREGKELSLLSNAPPAYFSALAMNEAMVLAEFGDYVKATELIATVVSGARARQDTSTLLNSLINSGVIYSGQNADSAAFKVYREAFEIARINENEFFQCQLLMNLGAIEMRFQNFDRSIAMLEESLEKSRVNGFLSMEGLIHAMMGDYYLRTDQPDLAEAKYTLAETIQRKEDFLEDVPSSLLGKADAYLKLKKYKDGIQTANQALTLTRELDNYTETRDAHHLLYELFFEVPVPDSALYHYIAYSEAKDSISSMTTKSAAEYYTEQSRLSELLKIAELERDLVRSEKKRQSSNFLFIIIIFIIILIVSVFGFVFYKRRKEAISQQKESLLRLERAQSEMKALRAQMDPHFIYGAVQSIKYFIAENNPEDAMKYLDKFSILMRMVLENSEHDDIPVRDEIGALTHYVELEKLRAKKPFSFIINIDKSVDVDEDYLPPLILQPFVENAIWHGLLTSDFKGELTVDILKENDALKCTITDNGIGRSASSKLLNPSSFKKKSMATQITRERLSVRNDRTNTQSGFTIVDLYSKNGSPEGTRVEIVITEAI